MTNYDKKDLLKVEMFEHLFPGLFYHGTQKEQLDTIDVMLKDGNNFIKYIYHKICAEDGIEYPYTDDDFKVDTFERGGIYFIRLHVPGRNPDITEVHRVYILYTKLRDTQEIVYWRYFTIKKFWDSKETFLFYIDPEMNILIGDEVPDDDLNKEVNIVAHTYLHMIASEFSSDDK